MLSAVLVIVCLAALCSVTVAFALARDSDSNERLIERIDRLLPQTQCGRCTYAGCKP